ncbi:reverse transcriptase domain-containing protein [Tanacetum coccineum]
MLKAGKLSHIIRELKQNSGKEQPKKKGETSGKEKPQAILMIQSRQNTVRQKITQSFSPDLEISFPSLGNDEGAEGPLIIEAEVGGHQVHRMCIDGGSSFEILYEHCFNRLRPEIRNQMVPATTSLVGFSGEIKWPLGQITLLVKVGDDEHSTSAWMDFMVVRSTSPFNGIIGRPGLRKMKAVPSTTHGMIKFPVMGGTLTLRSSKIIPIECAMISGPEDQPPPVNKVKEERIKVAINPEHPEQTVMIGSDLTEKTRSKLCNLLQRSLDIFAWTPTDMTGVPRQIAEHKLNVRKGCQPVRQKKRGQAAERNVAINDEVSKLVTAGIMREVHYHDWLSNPVMVKKSDNSWRMCVDFKDLNKACPKDSYPLPEIDWKVESLCGFPFKCFLDTYKGYHQIQMVEEDEEKTAFITNQGIFCYTKMPFGLRNVGATYQRLVDKTFHGQIGRNLEVYVDDLVIKSHTEDEVVRDIEETFKTLRKINMKLNPKKCTFGVEEGIKARLGKDNKNWSEEISHVLWAHRTMIKSSNGDTLFSLTYRTEAVIPTEIGMPTFRTAEVNVAKNEEALEINLELLEEKKEQAAIREAKSKRQMEKYYNNKVRNVSFKPGDLVYRSNEASRVEDTGKLGPKWEVPYEVTKALGKGSYKLKDCDGRELPRTWNVCNLKKCYIQKM